MVYKFLSKLAVSILLFTSCLAYAQTTSGLPKRLEAERDQYISEITTLRGAALMSVADKITGSGLNDEKLYAAVMSVFSTLTQQHYASPKDKMLANEVSALARTAAAMSPNSKNQVSELVDQSPSSGVRNRAHRLVPKLEWFRLRNEIMMTDTSAYAPEQKLMSYRFINLVKYEKDPSFSRWACEEIFRQKGADPLVYQAIREMLEKDKYYSSADDGLQRVMWFAKILSNFDNQASIDLLKSMKADPKVHKKVKKYISV